MSLSKRFITKITKTLNSYFCHICRNKVLGNLECCLEIVCLEIVHPESARETGFSSNKDFGGKRFVSGLLKELIPRMEN